MTTNTHHIKKLTLDFQLSGKYQPAQVQPHIAEWFEKEFKKELDAVLEGVDTRGEIIRFEQIVLDVGQVSWENLAQMLKKELERQLKFQLDKLRRDRTPESGSMHMIGAKAQDETDRKANFIRSDREHKTEAFIHFLLKGTMEWWSPLRTQEDLIAWLNEMTNAANAVVGNQLWERLKKEVKKNTEALNRMVHSVPVPVLKKWIKKEQTKWSGKLNVEQLFWRLVLTQSPVISGELKTFFLLRLQLERAVNPELEEQQYMERCLERLVKEGDKNTLERLIKWLKSETLTLELKKLKSGLYEKAVLTYTNEVISHVNKVVGNKSGALPKKAPAKNENINKTTVNHDQHELSEIPAKLLAQITKELVTEEKTDAAIQSCILTHAGIVLTWPMLSTFFRNRELLNEQEFKNEMAQFKALQLLNALTFGTEDVPEFEMPLNKLLCGLPVHAALPLMPQLTRSDWEEINDLMEHIVRSWPVLKNTTPAGLREGFIQRKGELIEQPETWLLKVEQKGIDVLMNKLPWGIGWIKLPWMSKIMRVEW